MLFVEFRFFFFFLIVFLVYWGLRNHRARKVFLLLCSYFFYGCWDWRFLTLLFASTTLDYVFGRLLCSSENPGIRRAVISLSLIYNLGLIAFFKYCNFFVDSAATFLSWLGLPASFSVLQIVIPVGVSFFTFQSMSYTLDIYRRKLPAVRSYLDLALFIAFFPQLVAGPIVRASVFLPQLASLRQWGRVDFRGAVVLFVMGFIKKACVAEGVAPFVDQYFAAPGQFDSLSAWIAVLLYAIQIYCDFSGYTDMAIASAKMLGYELTPNFAFPYFSINISQFWHRWHMSLSTWLRDYLYISLGGNRGGRWMTIRNLMLTMFLGGLWHGGAWTFVIWGGLHGVALVAHREWTRIKGEQPVARLGARIFGTLATFGWVCVAWIFFRSHSLPASWETLKQCVFLGEEGKERLDPRLFVVFAGLALVHGVNAHFDTSSAWRRLPWPVFAFLLGLIVAIILLFVPSEYKPFIYFQF